MTNVEQFRNIAQELGDLYEKKNTAYGNSFSDTYKKLGLISAVTRISDKFNRLCNLATNPDIDNLGESIEDTLRDMASYCIMTVMELENTRGNVIKKGDISYKCSMEIPEDAPVLAMVREEDKKIRKGDKFECIQSVVMDDGSIAYIKGKAYTSENDNCITDETREDYHYWNAQEPEKENWWHYFKRI